MRKADQFAESPINSRTAGPIPAFLLQTMRNQVLQDRIEPRKSISIQMLKYPLFACILAEFAACVYSDWNSDFNCNAAIIWANLLIARENKNLYLFREFLFDYFNIDRFYKLVPQTGRL